MRIVPFAAATLVALAIATPASAQFGGLKKHLKQKAVEKGVSEVVTPGAKGGTIVLTEDVVGQLLTGLQAGQAERQAAAKEDTPYGQYKKAAATYAEAKPKCEAAYQAFPTRMAANEKMANKFSALMDKMSVALGKGDQKAATAYQDQAMAMVDPSCKVKEPKQPDDYNDVQREVDSRAEKQEVKASGFTASELAMVKERAEAILRGATPPGDASPMEKSAVAAKSAELKPLLGIQDQPTARAAKPAPAPEPAVAAAPMPSSPQVSPEAMKMSECMAKNIQAHEAQIEALGNRGEAAQKAGNNAKMMAIADTIQRIQMAGCKAR